MTKSSSAVNLWRSILVQLDFPAMEWVPDRLAAKENHGWQKLTVLVLKRHRLESFDCLGGLL